MSQQSKMNKDVDVIKIAHERALKALQSQLARFVDHFETKQDILKAEVEFGPIADLEISKKVNSFIEWNENFHLAQSEMIDEYKDYVEELFKFVRNIENNETEVIKMTQMVQQLNATILLLKEEIEISGEHT